MSPSGPRDDKKTFEGFDLTESAGTVLDPIELDDDEITENTDTSILPLPLSADAGLDPTRFQVEGLLGTGGMGEVERIVDRLLGRHVARKRIKKELIGSHSVRSRFEDEARITAQLDHPGIISVHDMGIDAEGRPWFTMKEVRGTTFTRVISEHFAARAAGMDRSEGGWTRHRTIQVFRQSCEAIGYAHHRGVLHRDIKPDNIMVGNFGEAWVLDWGLAKLVGDREHASGPDQAPHISLGSPDSFGRTQQGSLTGTPAFMSPEQARGEHDTLTPASDVWSLGAVLFTLLASQPPWHGLDIYDIVARLRRSETPPWPRRALQDAPAILVEICQKALHPDPGQRHPHGGALGEAIADWLEGAQRREQALELVGQAEQLEIGRCNLEAEAAEEREHQIIRLLHAALTHAPHLPEAHEGLATYYQGLHRQAELTGDHLAARRWEDLVRVHDDGRRADYLEGTGRLTLVTEPPGAQLTLCRLEHGPQGITEIELEDLGVSPLVERSLAMGSYVVRVEAQGCHPLRYPVSMARQAHWDGTRPGDTAPTPIRLLPLGSLEEEDCYIPAGWFIGGSDHEVLDHPIPRRLYWCDALICKRHPVTNAEYLEFLNDLLSQDREEDALAHVPMETAGIHKGQMIYHRDDEGRFFVGEDADGHLWIPEMPVVNVSVRSAMAYAAWMRQRSGQHWRLPMGLEWEKAARGVDGKLYPWGMEFKHGSCNHRGAVPGRLGPVSVADYPMDQSVYGVRGMAANVMEWCALPFLAAIPVTPEGLIQANPLTTELRGRYSARGGCWDHARFHCRVDIRKSQAHHKRIGTVGFRIIRNLDQ